MKYSTNYFSTTDGTKIHYITVGSGTAILLLHGNNGSLQYFSYQIPFFSKYLKVYALDSRDHGLSTNTKKQLDFSMMAEDLQEFIVAKKLKEVILLGFSDGANLAMTYTLMHPEKVKGLILNGGNLAPFGLNFLGKFLTFVQIAFVNFLSLISNKGKRLKRIYELQTKEIEFTFADLKKITTPTLIIVGQFDLISDLHSQKIAKAIPDSQFIVVKGGIHSVARQKSEIFNASVLKFIKEKVLNANNFK